MKKTFLQKNFTKKEQETIRKYERLRRYKQRHSVNPKTLKMLTGTEHYPLTKKYVPIRYKLKRKQKLTEKEFKIYGKILHTFTPCYLKLINNYIDKHK